MDFKYLVAILGRLKSKIGGQTRNAGDLLKVTGVCLEKMEAIVMHYKWVPYAKAMHFRTILEDWASNILHRVHKRSNVGDQHTALS
jgi:hypothetical protein